MGLSVNAVLIQLQLTLLKACLVKPVLAGDKVIDICSRRLFYFNMAKVGFW